MTNNIDQDIPIEHELVDAQLLPKSNIELKILQAEGEDNKVAFEIGWDMACYDLPYRDTGIQSVAQGYHEAKKRNIKYGKPDRYVKKWILLRLNALKRGRIFDASVSVDFLRKIDTSICPVTMIPLTYGTGKETDWSVDRINNNASYSAGNIVIVSTLANLCKDKYNFKDMLSFAYEDNPDNQPNTISSVSRPLTKIEWARWANIASFSHVKVNEDGRQKFGHICAPCVSKPPKGVVFNPSAALQLVISIKVHHHTSRYFDDLTKDMPKPVRRMLNDVVRRAEKVNHPGLSHALDIWMNKRLFEEFKKAYHSIPQSNLMKINAKVTNIIQIIGIGNEVPNWGVETNGYMHEKEISRKNKI